MPFMYLDENRLVAEHGLPFVLQIPENFEVMKPFSYQADFHGRPFNVTVCAFWKEDTIIAIHAERLADNSGILDYSYMEPDTLSGIQFYRQTHLANLKSSDVHKAKDLKYFKSQGFDFSPSIHLRQYFYHSKDGNAEFVMTLGKKIGEHAESNLRVASDLDVLETQLVLSLKL